MTWFAVGVTGVSVAGKAYSAFSGSKKAKKRAEELRQKIAAITAKVAESTRNRLREVDKLTDAQMDAADEQLNLVTDYYADLKLKYEALKERNQAEAERQYGTRLATIEQSLQDELGIQSETFDEYRTELDSLYQDSRDLIQADLAHNSGLRDEFKTNADQAIRDTWEASDSAKIDLQNLKDSGGRPENFDRVIAENAKAFGDINKTIDRSDAQRGRTDLTGKKMTSMFAEAMAKGNIAGQMGEIGQREEAARRGEVAGLGQQAQNQSYQAMQGAQTQDGQIMANLGAKFRGQAIDSIMTEGMNALGMESDANRKGEIAQELLLQTTNELNAMVDRGELTRAEAEMHAKQMNVDLKMDATRNNWNYKDAQARGHEQNMLATVGMADKELQSIDTSIDYGGIISSGANTFASLYGGGGFGGGASKPQGVPQNAYTPNGPQGVNSFDYQPSQKPSLYGQPKVNQGGSSTIPVNPYDQRKLGRY